MKKRERRGRVYLSGPMTGLTGEEIRRLFGAAARRLRGEGYTVVSPAEFAVCRWPWLYRLLGYRLTLLYDLWRLSRCDAVAMLDGWQQSRGALAERQLALSLGMEVMESEATKRTEKGGRAAALKI